MNPFIISGPCSVETQEQFEQTISELINLGITEIRGGVWKPRTMHGQFEGLGEDALKIISKAREKYFFNTYVEVANKEQVELCEKYNIDNLWIGARTTGNPFSVQEIADSIKDKSKKILVKNPINYDIKLWQGAIGRFLNSGVENISIIFRGFNTHSIYRFNPIFEAIDDLKNTTKRDFETYIDVSHIAGHRDYLSHIISKAKSLGYGKFMIESHTNPEVAYTDALQQIKPKELIDLLFSNNLLDYERAEIDHIDNEIIALLKKRQKCSESIGHIKIKSGKSFFDKKRHDELSNKYGEYKGIYESIHEQSIKTQEKL